MTDPEAINGGPHAPLVHLLESTIPRPAGRVTAFHLLPVDYIANITLCMQAV